MFYEVIPEGKVESFIYDYPDSLLPGQVVMVPVGKRTVPGVVVNKVEQPKFKTKTILKVLYSKPLPKHLLETVGFIHDYYLVALGQAITLVLPRGVEKKRRKTEQMFGYSPLVTEAVGTFHSGPRPSGPSPRADGANSRAAALRNAPSLKCPRHPSPAHIKCLSKSDTAHGIVLPLIKLNPAQKIALEGLQKAPGATKLLFGVTGSGKTNIYLKMAANALLEQKSTLLLVPEIALTGQLVNVFKEVFGERVVLMHSGQTEAERHLIFNSLLESTEPYIVVGPRSALFAPLSNIGLIVIDEEHESSYAQENAPRYSAIRVASFMAKTLKCPLVLGSATPTVEDYYIASKRDSVVELMQKAKNTAKKPQIKIVDFKNRDNFTKNKYFSDALIQAISDNIETKKQTLIFHNRRGSAPLTICENCGEELMCPNCFLPLTLHADAYELVCHTCEYHTKVPVCCPKCGAPGLIHKGFGTKLLEAELHKLFPKARIKRFDADNKRGEEFNVLYPEVRDGKIDILIGTQTIVKGLDLPRLATVGVVQADAGISLPDYVAEERVFQLLTQVIGRVGRGHLEKAEAFIQTFRPEHPALLYAINEDYLGFYDYLIKKRQKSGFPPFKFIMRLEITMKTEASVLKKVRSTVKELAPDNRLVVSPPRPAFHERTNKGYTWQIIVRSRSRNALLEVCNKIDKNFKVVLDPPGLL